MKMMPLSEIVPDNPYLRLNTDVVELVASIKSLGLIHPLTVNESGLLLAGGRRYHACRLLGLEEVPVIVVDKSDLEQELISIDENLVRRPLDKLEFEKCLNRGREIYEQLNPTTPKVLELEEKKGEEEPENFSTITAEKTGLSPNVIKAEIKRDELSSANVKEARKKGEISASQANEIIKLNQDEQDELLDFIGDRTVKEVREIVEDVRASGLENAIKIAESKKRLPKEVKQLYATAKKLKKLLSKVVIEEIICDAPEVEKLQMEMLAIDDLSFSLKELYGWQLSRSRADDDFSESSNTYLN